MTRCGEFYKKIERDGNFCNMDRTAFQRTVDYIEFCKENNVPLGTLSERATRLLIKEKDPVVKAKVIEKIEKGLKLNRTPTEEQLTRTVQNVREGKDNRGRNPTVEVEDKPAVNLGDYLDPVNQDSVVTEPVDPNTEETEFEEVNSDNIYLDPADEDGDPGDIPVLPDEEDDDLNDHTHTVAHIPPVEEDKDVEDDVVDPEEDVKQGNPEITEKVVKEYLKNAGHQDAPPKPKPAPTEEVKQAMFDKAVSQALEWEMDGDEIFRRIRKAIMFAEENVI